VLLDGGGFDAPRMSARVSLANLPDDAYEPIGRAIAELLDDCRARFTARAAGRSRVCADSPLRVVARARTTLRRFPGRPIPIPRRVPTS
jgi:hypothetical protein